jgi:hypothetical protein
LGSRLSDGLGIYEADQQTEDIMRGLIGYLRQHHWGMLATFIALSGTAYASGALPLPPNSVGTRQLRDGAVTLGKIRPSAQVRLRMPPTQPTPTEVIYNLPAPRTVWATAPGYPHVTYYRDTGDVVHLAGVTEAFFHHALPEDPPSGPANACGIDFGNGEYSPIFILPPGDRPSGHLVFAVESGNANGRIDVTPDGWVSCAIGRSDEYVSLDGITFRAG